MADGADPIPDRCRATLERLAEIYRAEGVAGLEWRARRHLRNRARFNPVSLRLRYHRARLRSSGAGADPLCRYRVDPDRITRVTGSITPTDPGAYHLDTNDPIRHEAVGFGAVLGGDWDLETDAVTDFAEYESMRRRFREGVLWEETELFRGHRERIEAGHRSYGVTTVDALRSRCRRIEALYDDIDANGYRPRRYGREDILHEIQVAIGREGEPLYTREGRHRLLVAKLLGVDAVPVLVVARHEELLRP